MLLEGLISLGNFSFSCLLVPLESFEIRHQNTSEVNVIWCLGDWHTLHDYFFRTRCIFESVSCIIKVCEGPSTNCDKSHFSPYSFFYEDGERCHTWNSTLIWIFVRISSYLLLVAGTSFLKRVFLQTTKIFVRYFVPGAILWDWNMMPSIIKILSPFISKISLVYLLTFCHKILNELVWRILY